MQRQARGLNDAVDIRLAEPTKQRGVRSRNNPTEQSRSFRTRNVPASRYHSQRSASRWQLRYPTAIRIEDDGRTASDIRQAHM